jgi:alpha-ketoglutaric semialdehyde dehydrogenase
VFALLTGTGRDIGQALVAHPAVQAVGFTGSRAGGTSLMGVAAARPQPIPVYAEMSSINPVFLLPQALKARGAAIGKEFAASLVMGVGQFCTNPGLVLAVEGEGLERSAPPPPRRCTRPSRPPCCRPVSPRATAAASMRWAPTHR